MILTESKAFRAESLLHLYDVLDRTELWVSAVPLSIVMLPELPVCQALIPCVCA